MKYLILALFFSLIPAQLSGIQVVPGVYIYLHDIILTLLLIAAVLFGKKVKSVHMTLVVPIFGFISVGIVSLLINSNRFSNQELLLSSLYLGRWAAYAGIYVVVRRFERFRSFWLPGLAGVGTAIAFLGLLQYVLYPDLRNLEYLGWDPHYYRLFSTFLDPNYAGIMLVLTLVACWYTRTILNRKIFLASIVTVGLALYLTYSRGSYLAFLAALAVYGIFTARTKHVLMVILTIILAIVWIPKPGGDTLRLDRLDSTISRFGNWSESINLISQSPILGYGFNTLRFVRRDQPEGEFISRAAAGVDSSILFIFITTGVVGFITYLWLGKRVVNLVRSALNDRQTRNMSIAVAASLAAVCTHSLFSNSLFYPWVMVWLWILVGVLESNLTYTR